MSTNKMQFRPLSDIIGIKTIRVSKPKNKGVYEAEYYCQNQDCVVREVEIYVKLHGEPNPRDFICPCCFQDLKFHCYLEHQAIMKDGSVV